MNPTSPRRTTAPRIVRLARPRTTTHGNDDDDNNTLPVNLPNTRRRRLQLISPVTLERGIVFKNIHSEMRSVKIQVSISHPARINIDFSELSNKRHEFTSTTTSVSCVRSVIPHKSNQDRDEGAITNHTSLNPWS
ncbi:hypothetical protein F2P81_008104 [Scophthalmus maximus]|uniref:Uncharacterized protein n=1 Tax=Scophthalmus maximus TaxID=52904 RepID=A0A6A4T4M9_SCOMX|nr:hypothetical protein F2P81_008104 [Scophthalmus maximus]